MSATGRNLVGAERHGDDFYSTPSWTTRAILPFLINRGSRMTTLDPCCGDGAILKELLGVAGVVSGIEINGARAQAAADLVGNVVCRDALGPESWGSPNLIKTNPPYALAMQFVVRALAEVARGGEVAMLLRLPWLASQERAAFHRAHPSDVYVLPKRPSFVEHLRWSSNQCPLLLVGNGKSKPPRCQLEAGHADRGDGDCRTLGTDATDYGWFCWGPGRGNRWHVLDVEGAGR